MKPSVNNLVRLLSNNADRWDPEYDPEWDYRKEASDIVHLIKSTYPELEIAE